MKPESYSVEELTVQAGVSVRTLRYYIAEGLLAGPSARGKAARYTPEHLWRLRLIRHLSGQHLPLAQIRERLTRLSGPEVRQLVEGQTPHCPSPRAYLEGLLDRARAISPAPRAPLPTPASDTWRRLTLKSGLELHLRADVERRYGQLVRRLQALAEAE